MKKCLRLISINKNFKLIKKSKTIIKQKKNTHWKEEKSNKLLKQKMKYIRYKILIYTINTLNQEKLIW